eukprot:PhM_4_TR7581/c0_g1_i1/m.30703/K00587/ICMT, STE14; protein-S-isoprenylcysteine O-methyltransferase
MTTKHGDHRDPCNYGGLNIVYCTVTSFCLGAIFCFGISCALLFNVSLGLYMALCISTFHMSEFLVCVRYRRREASDNAFLINHSPAYTVATVLCWVEFAIEWFLFPSLKSHTLIPCVGFLLAATCYGIRVVSMIQAASNFNFMIETEKREEHQLVTTGLYRVLRHPSYFGWFWYAVFSQVIVMNPICLVLYTVVTWRFFKNRIEFEEEILESEEFFGEKYADYRKATRIGIPMI